MSQPFKSIVDFAEEMARESNLPFAVQIAPSGGIVPVRVEEIGPIKFPLYGQYTAIEQFFLEGMDARSASRQIELQLLGQEVVSTIKQHFRIDDPKLAQATYLRVLGLPNTLAAEDSQEVEVNPITEADIQGFRQEHFKLLQNLNAASIAIAGQTVMTMFVVTFFMRSRVDETWDFGNTFVLQNSVLLAIYEAIKSDVAEANTTGQEINTPEAAIAPKPGDESKLKRQRGSLPTGSDSTPTLTAA